MAKQFDAQHLAGVVLQQGGRDRLEQDQYVGFSRRQNGGPRNRRGVVVIEQGQDDAGVQQVIVDFMPTPDIAGRPQIRPGRVGLCLSPVVLLCVIAKLLGFHGLRSIATRRVTICPQCVSLLGLMAA